MFNDVSFDNIETGLWVELLNPTHKYHTSRDTFIMFIQTHGRNGESNRKHGHINQQSSPKIEFY